MTRALFSLLLAAAPIGFSVDTVYKDIQAQLCDGPNCWPVGPVLASDTTYDTTWVYPVEKKEK